MRLLLLLQVMTFLEQLTRCNLGMTPGNPEAVFQEGVERLRRFMCPELAGCIAQLADYLLAWKQETVLEATSRQLAVRGLHCV
jgi:hypothetical protein